MVDRTEGLQYQTGQGYGALDAQSARDRLDGFSVVSGLGVSPGGSLSVDVAAGEALVGSGATVSPGSTQNVSLAAADSTNPRKDTVWIDDTGTAQVETGAAETELPEGNARFNTFQPEPPFPSGDGTILAEVWVAAGATSLSSADIRDRRQPADVITDTVEAQTVSTGQTAIGGTGPILEMGVVDHGAVSAGSSSAISPTFKQTYDSPPGVVHYLGTSESVSSGDLTEISVAAAPVGTDEFQSLLRNDSASEYTFDKCGYIVVDD